MMRGVRTLARVMVLGFLRDRISLFFAILFPLFFLVLFGGIFKDQGASAVPVQQIGPVPIIDSLPPDARTELDKVLKITKTNDEAAAVEAVRKGDSAAAYQQRGDQLVVRYSAADQIRSGILQGVLNSLVQQQNQAATGRPPRYSLVSEQVEDKSLKAIQYVTPGILGWAIASGATAAAAFTLVQWRKNKLLRRLQLTPVGTGAIVTARVGVSIGVALLQTALFIGLAQLPYFGLQLSHYWWMSIPVILAGTLAFLSIGLLAGAIAKTEEAAALITNLVILPMAFLSGAFIPLDFSPKWVQTVANIFPLKHLVTGVQDVMVRGKGPGSVLPELAILLAFAVVLAAIAVKAFRWEDD
jgi:ABC-2 type transport system permease protein